MNNVSERDKEEARKRKLDKQSLQREKLAKVREHNDAVLRVAAMASISRSAVVGEDMEETIGEKSVGETNKLWRPCRGRKLQPKTC